MPAKINDLILRALGKFKRIRNESPISRRYPFLHLHSARAKNLLCSKVVRESLGYVLLLRYSVQGVR